MSLLSPVFDEVTTHLIGAGLRLVQAALQGVAVQIEKEIGLLVGSLPATAPTQPGK